MLGLTLTVLCGTLWVTGRCFDRGALPHSIMVVKVWPERSPDRGWLTQVVYEAPPEKPCPINLLWCRASIADLTVYADAPFTRLNIPKHIIVQIKPDLRDQIFSNVVWSNQFPQRGIIRRVGYFRLPLAIKIRRIIGNATGAIADHIGWPNPKISQSYREGIGNISATVTHGLAAFYVRNEQEWPIDVKRGLRGIGSGLSRQLHFLGDADQLKVEPSDQRSSNSGYRSEDTDYYRRCAVALLLFFCGCICAVWGVRKIGLWQWRWVLFGLLLAEVGAFIWMWGWPWTW